MSSQSNPNQDEGDKQEGFTKYFRRMKTVWRRNLTPRSSEPSMPEISGRSEASKATARQTTPITTALAQKPVTKSAPQPIVVDHWSAIQQEKARALFAKYGLTLEPYEWQSSSDVTVERVVKPIRMRVRRTCHRCQTPYGPDKICVNCQHVRCTKCPRHPPVKSKDQTESALQMLAAAKEQPLPFRYMRKEPHAELAFPQITLPSRTSGQDLLYKASRQRVRRTCHRCNTVFPSKDSTECFNCKHIRCKKCPRDPPKFDKYPDGYPGDAEPPTVLPARTWKRPRQRVRYNCHKCSTMYRPGDPICSNCGQEKGPETIRDPPKKQKPQPDPEIVRRVEERLAKMEFIRT